MSGLYRTLNIGSESLSVTRMGVDTAGHNIANAQVEGYSRQRLRVSPRPPHEVGGVVLGAGAYSESIARAHDQWTEKHLNRANQSAGASSAKLEALKSMEGLFSPDLQAGIDMELTSFFNAAQNLSGFPDDVTVRTSFRESARNLTQAFKRVEDGLQRERSDLNQKIAFGVSEVNHAMEQIAKLNGQIREQETLPGANANDLRDERDRILRDLTRKIDVTYYENQDGVVCVRGPGDSLLVDGTLSTHMFVQANNDDGMYEVRIEGPEGGMEFDLSKSVGAGEISAMIEVRDRLIPGLRLKNNELAAGIAGSINAVHREGYGLNGFQEQNGRDLFKISGDLDSAAATFSLDDAIEASTDAISFASTPMAAGDNVVGNRILALKDEKILAGSNNFMQFYTDMVGGFGAEITRAEYSSEAEEILVQDLENKREAVSGVSLDEEATNLMRWQANFAASSKVITTVDEMLETVLSIKR